MGATRKEKGPMKSVLVWAALLAIGGGRAWAQSNSLFKDGRVAKPGQDGVRATSLVRVTTRADRVFKPHDLITIVIREKTSTKTTADAQTDKSTSLRAVVDAWPRINGAGVVQDIAPLKPEVVKVRADRAFDGGGSKQRSDSFTECITAEVVDVKPNGTLVLEARKERQWMGEHQTLTITGVIRREDVDANNTVASENIANLCLSYETRGQVADASRRGWFDRILDFLNIF
jgi:flagellar L-ring protein precursor FlgH